MKLYWKPKWWCFLMLLSFSVVSLAATFGSDTSKKLDVRILVDGSSKMLAEDPDNHRSDALKLFINLLPNNAHAGIWVYGERSLEVMKPGKTGFSWKAQALKQVEELPQGGEFGDLERALAVATLDWVTKDKDARRHIVLITDGKPSVSASKDANAASKQRILDHQIEQLRTVGVQVHTLGVTEEADVTFLDQMASTTQGWFDLIKTPELLEKGLLRVSKRLVEKNTVPLVAKKFTVDETVREFTAVVFRKKGFGSTQLDDPEGMDFGKNSQRDGVTWHREKKYDIVTVSRPMEGDWRLIAPDDSNHQIFITTNLQLVIDPLPEQIFSKSDTRLRVLLSDKGKLITNSNFLNSTQMTATIKNKKGEEVELEMQQDMINGGYFFIELAKELKPGPYSLSVNAVGATFERHEDITFHVQPKPKIEYTEVKPIFRDVMTQAGITLPEQGVTEEQVLECPDISKIIVNEEGVLLDEAAAAEAETDWVVTSIIVAVVNILLGVGIFFGLKMYRKKSKAAEEAIISQLSS